MPFPFKAKDELNSAPAGPTFAKKSARKRKSRRAPAQKALTQPRAMSGGGR